MSSKKFYVVWRGSKTGIFNDWKNCEQAIKGFAGALYKSFNNEEIAKYAYQIGPGGNLWQKMTDKDYTALSKKMELPVLNSLSVDAACSGNPGIMEYRGVDTKSGIELFSQGPFEEGTVNIGEFLAIVHGLAQLKKEKKSIPIYTDSMTAMKWVKEKHVNTRLERSSRNKQLFEFVGRAVMWLKSNSYSNKILKWDTGNWGEIPADYGRK
ncbi:MAG: ribonuclease H family protein [Bacteroidales bacterium]|nr:ribonuclease H family protein [Bacteroidales bacterium]MCF8343525.1 ribonuclease H family protein [Bacteroidales bacterium]MCF8349816.1 ribonuclease H family protein [Bacteroidales bacterium]MCF8375936.1 ribonuclease H family protein [Bacteroidales bacterium]